MNTQTLSARRAPGAASSTFRNRARALLAAALAAASLGAVAQAVAPLTRAEVQAELARARASGEIERSMSESFGLGWMNQERFGLTATARAEEQKGHAESPSRQARHAGTPASVRAGD